MIKYKTCNCDDEDWETIVAKDDYYFPNKRVIYFHCLGCDEDFRIEDFETGEELFLPDEPEENSAIPSGTNK